MKSDNVFVRLIVNGLAGGFLGVVLVGGLGFLFAGYQGFLNGAILGGVMVIVGGFASISTLENIGWFTGVISRYGQRHHSDKDDN